MKKLLGLLGLAVASFAQDPLANATALLRAGKFAEAHRMLAHELESNRTDVRLYTLDGFALARGGDANGAVTAYQNALQTSAAYLPALEGMAEVKYKLHAPDAAEWIERLLKTKPDEQTAHAMLGTLAFERGDCEEAERQFAQAEKVVTSQPEAAEARGACLLKLKRSAAAAGTFADLAARFPQQPHFRYNLAVSQMEGGLYADALSTVTSTPQLENDADALDLLADVRERRGETPEAIAALRKAIVLRPDDPRLYLHFAAIALAHHSFPAGVDMLNAGLQRSPQAAPLYLARGILRVQLAQYSEAEQDFAQAEKLDPASRYSGALKSMVKLQQNELEPAVEEVRGRVRAKPDDALLQYLLAETLARRGATPGSPEFAEALKAGQKAVALQPHFALARDVLGRLYLQMGDTANALRESRLAFANDPTDQTALYHLIRAMRSAGKADEVAQLTAQLASLRAEAQKKEMEERRYAIVTDASPKSR